jgi:hypothetical protein
MDFPGRSVFSLAMKQTAAQTKELERSDSFDGWLALERRGFVRNIFIYEDRPIRLDLWIWLGNHFAKEWNSQIL